MLQLERFNSWFTLPVGKADIPACGFRCADPCYVMKVFHLKYFVLALVAIFLSGCAQSGEKLTTEQDKKQNKAGEKQTPDLSPGVKVAWEKSRFYVGRMKRDDDLFLFRIGEGLIEDG